MQALTKTTLRPATAKLVARIIAPLIDSGVVTAAEYQTISSTLKQIAKNGSPEMKVPAKLITPQETAEILGLSYSGFRAIESTLPLKRRHLGNKAIRYYLPEVVNMIESNALTEKGDGIEDERM